MNCYRVSEKYICYFILIVVLPYPLPYMQHPSWCIGRCSLKYNDLKIQIGKPCTNNYICKSVDSKRLETSIQNEVMKFDGW